MRGAAARFRIGDMAAGVAEGRGVGRGRGLREHLFQTPYPETYRNISVA